MLCIPIPTVLPSVPSKPQRLHRHLKMMFKRGRKGKTHLKTYTICPQAHFFEHTTMFYFNTQSPMRCKLLIYDYDKIIMVNLTCAGT